MSSTRTQSQLCTATLNLLFVQCHFGWLLSLAATFILIEVFCMYSHECSEYINELIHMVFTTDKFFDVAAESWPGWDLNRRPLKSVQKILSVARLYNFQV